ncbi:hypothetical protein [Streptomyces sp. NPDC058739]|uniref:hypothetical protein n=1 Tax=Streptomyces sp. NPDC058739 TaxID=3346618 RepID=UPI0036C45D0B
MADDFRSPSPAPRPPAEILRSVQFSCQLLFRREREFVEQFYVSLVDVLPEIRGLSAHGGRPLCDGLVRSVMWAALTQDSPDVVEATLRRVGASHRRQGFPVIWYRACGRALLDAAQALHREDWGSALSSHWVAYYTWLCGSLSAGAVDGSPGGGPGGGGPERAGPGPGREHVGAGPWPDGRGPERAGGAGPESLGAVLAELRARHFPGDEISLAAICTRVALRTGADLRNPRPDQNADPAMVHNALDVLLVLGYSLPSPAPDPYRPYEPRGTSPAGPVAERHTSPSSGAPDGPARLWRRLLGKAAR